MGQQPKRRRSKSPDTRSTRSPRSHAAGKERSHAAGKDTKERQSREDEQGEPPACRICLDSEPAGLFRPCKCKGSMQWVHVDCLNHWRKSSANPKAFHRCEQCLYEYRLGRVFHGDKLLLARFLGSRFAVEFSSVLVLVLLIFFAGFCSKAIVMTGLFGQNGTETWRQVWVVNWDHLIYGSVLVGGCSLIGWLGSLMNPMTRLPGIFNWGGGVSGGGGGGGDKKGAGGIILVIVVVVGLCLALVWIHGKVKEYASVLLKHSVHVILDVDADPTPEQKAR